MTGRNTAHRVAGLAELTAGVLLLAQTRRCWRAVATTPPSAVEALATRALGGRYLIQGLCQFRWPNRLVQTWAAVDFLHACTMAAVALRSNSAQRPAMLSAVIDTTNGLLQLAATRAAGGDVAGPATRFDGRSTTPPAANAHDGRSTPPSQSREAAQSTVIGARQQQVIDTVLDAHRGEPAPTAAIALQQGFVRAGLALPPQPWIHAVATSIASSQRYVVAAQPDHADEHDEPRTTGASAHASSDRLWFNNDPKIVRIDPDKAVEHGDEHST